MKATRDLVRRARELAKLREKATPGPWQWEQNGLCDALRNADGEYVFDIRTDYDCGMEWELDKQTAALIAAAPEMAELLDQLAGVLPLVQRLVNGIVSGDWVLQSVDGSTRVCQLCGEASEPGGQLVHAEDCPLVLANRIMSRLAGTRQEE